MSNFPPLNQPPPKPWRKRHESALIAAVVLAAVAIVTVASIAGRGHSSDASDDSDRCYATTYNVTADGPIDVTFQTSSGQTSQRDEASGSFSEQFCGRAGTFVYVSAQVNRESGTVSCSIKSTDHTTIANKSSGDYVIATCSGRL